MKRPSFVVMLAGAPMGALALFLLYAALIYGWYQGTVSWWVALAALAFAFRTLSAMGTRRRYLGWKAAWDAMETMAEPRAHAETKRGNGSGSIWIAALVWVGSLVSIPPAQGNDVLVKALALVCAVSSLYLVFRYIRRTVRRARAKRQKEADDAPVSWAVGRASSSPSRESAGRNLPGYSARVIGRESAKTD
jgi:hypothetical protein